MLRKKEFILKKPIISIILPSLNVGQYIQECIESVLKQTLTDIEIICVDAGSDDGTLEIIRQYEKKDRRISVFVSEKKSYGFQVNIGLNNANGEYIAIVDTDDLVEPTMYEDLLEYAKKYDLDYVKSDSRLFTEIAGERQFAGFSLIPDGFMSYERVFSVEDCPEIFMRPANIWDAIYKKDFLDKNNIMFNESKGAAFQDIGFSVQLFCFAKRIMYVDKEGYIYRMGRPGASCISPNVLSFLYQEYDRCLKNKYAKESTIEWKYLYGMMARVYIIQIDFLLKSGLKTIEQIESDEAYRWLNAKIKKALDDNVIESDMFVEKELWKDLISSIESFRDYADKIVEQRLKDEEKKRAVLKTIDNRSICVFGCGAMGEKAYIYLTDNNCRIESFCDNDSSLWNKTKYGERIVSPESLRSLKEDTVILIANKRHNEEIRNQLLEYGIDNNRILVW